MGNIEKGYLGSLIAEKKFIKNGFNVFKPVMENGKVDMIIEKNNVYLKIQIKTVQESRGSKNVPVRKISHNMGSYKTTTYNSSEIDYFIGVDIDTEEIYVIPVSFSEQYKSAISITKLTCYKDNFDLAELYNRNIINGEDNIGECLTGNADEDTEGMM